MDNPEEFAADELVSMDLLRLNVGLFASLGKGPVTVDELIIDSPVLNLEFTPDGRSNLEVVAANVEANREPANEKSAEIEPASKKQPKEPVRIAVRHLVIEGVSFNVRRADGSEYSATLPTIELHDVGGKEGKTPAGLGATVVLAMINEGLRQAVAHRLMDGVLFDGERILDFLADELELDGDQIEQLVPVIESMCQGLNSTIELWVDRGGVSLETLAEDFKPVVEEAEALVREILTEEQQANLQAILAEFDGGAVDAIRAALVDRLATALGLSPEQLEAAAPILARGIEEVGRLIGRTIQDPDRSRDDLVSGLEEIQARTRQELEAVLGAEQLAKLEQRHGEIREAILDALFPEE